ncbi:hypothetical protein M569_07007 [Genlisea aurea]|uniref:Tobamovirus multiplication protein 2A n=1 Tax=Genlisea aurea TaxID=192259 RepID=S8E5V6_9LAMI|nr:hypothetical protein M569_07007 [Genlisea aurea]
MACRGFFDCLLKLLNFLLILVGLAMIGYGIYLFVEYKNGASGDDDGPFPPSNPDIVMLGRPMLMGLYLADSIFDNLPRAWFIYLFTGIGVVVLVISCFGCIGASIRNRCCLTCYAVFVVLLILLELGLAAFVFFDKSWKEEIPRDKTGNFDQIYEFLDDNWEIIKWLALGFVIFEALLFLLALVVRAGNRPADYDSDEEYITAPRQQIRQPLISRPPVPAAGIPVAGTLDQRPSRNDAWSTRMREKYGLDTTEFTYNPSDPNRYQQSATQPAEERSRCTIM